MDTTKKLAEYHFRKGKDRNEVAKILGISPEKLIKLFGSKKKLDEAEKSRELIALKMENALIKKACGYSYTASIAKTSNHTLGEIPAKAATCTTPGNNKYYKCSVCGKYFDTNMVETTPKAQVIAASGHNFTGAAKDNGNGTHSYLCKNAGCSEYGNATAHTYGNWNVTERATCVKEGKQQHTCSVCGSVETKAVPVDTKTGHDADKVLAVAHTCTTDGVVEHWHCKLCGKNFADLAYTRELDSVVDPAAHVGPAQEFEAKKATCTEEGRLAHFKCAACGKLFKDRALTQPTTVKEITLAKAPHEYTGEWFSGENGHWHKCANCTATTAVEEHTFEAKSDVKNTWEECTVCGYKKNVNA